MSTENARSTASGVKSQRGTTLIDLSTDLFSGMPAHAFFPSPIILPYVDHLQAKAAGLGEPGDPMTYAINYISMLEHVGTHVDAPYHIGVDGAPIDQMPLDWFTGKAVVLDLRHIPDLAFINVEELEKAEAASGVEIDGHIVLMCSGFHARHWPNREIVTNNPGLTYEASLWLAERSRIHGVEGPSTDTAGTKEFPNHRVCRDKGMIHYEFLCNLEGLVGKGEFQFHGFPLKWKDGTGSPVRALAELP
ncbi:MAG: cyclase family protein [Actinomycetia bacterium]|nr:cyclase family protein [Actinomycetes bacterium]